MSDFFNTMISYLTLSKKKERRSAYNFWIMHGMDIAILHAYVDHYKNQVQLLSLCTPLDIIFFYVVEREREVEMGKGIIIEDSTSSFPVKYVFCDHTAILLLL